jgi:hypothetical protein
MSTAAWRLRGHAAKKRIDEWPIRSWPARKLGVRQNLVGPECFFTANAAAQARFELIGEVIRSVGLILEG